MTYKRIETSKATYICEDVTEEKGRYHLKNAVEIEGDWDCAEIANNYLKAELMGTSKGVSVSRMHLESIVDAPEESKLIDMLKAFLPEAERRARTKAVLMELSNAIKGYTETGS